MNILRIMILTTAFLAVAGCGDDDDLNTMPTGLTDNGSDTAGDETGGDGGMDGGDDTAGGDDGGSGDGAAGDDGTGSGGSVAFNQFVIDQFDVDANAEPTAVNGLTFEFDNSDPAAFDEVLAPPAE